MCFVVANCPVAPVRVATDGNVHRIVLYPTFSAEKRIGMGVAPRGYNAELSQSAILARSINHEAEVDQRPLSQSFS